MSENSYENNKTSNSTKSFIKEFFTASLHRIVLEIQHRITVHRITVHRIHQRILLETAHVS